MTPKVNKETLQRLSVEIGEDMLSSLFVVFSDELDNYSQQLQQNPTAELVCEISHAVKSSAASFGADALSELGCECEIRLKQGQETWVRAQLPTLIAMLQNVANDYRNLATQQNLLNYLE